ncbi:MAG: hypothetical protein QNJ49_19810 [Mastigocoleus sp. MO_167.B18]|nr:hypothetical protein [Mastigocoleus sp. MO_167.B18]
MKKYSRKSINSLLKSIFSQLRLVLIGIPKILLYLICEGTIYALILIIAVLLVKFGMPQAFALGLSITLIIATLIISYTTIRQHRIITRRSRKNRPHNSVKGEVRFADAIAGILSQNSPREWEEYQDWLHDILLARCQLLDRKIPGWKVTLITYWRLTALCITVSAIKLRRFARIVRKLR